MVVGICTLELDVPDSRSLKEKRRVVRSVVERLRNRLNASVAEVEPNGTWNRATVGLAVVSRSEGEARRILERAVNQVEEHFPRALADYHIEIV
jgi:uncharacterized protein YlxP (DUF503 family)